MCGHKGAIKMRLLSLRDARERISNLSENVRKKVLSSTKESKYFAIQLERLQRSAASNL